jgi:hypothetical protein
MKKSIIIATLIVSGALLVAPASFASEFGRRQICQQRRIAVGIELGRLTPWEVASLERQEARLRAERFEFREHHFGHVTRREAWFLNRQENRLSHEIYRDNHNWRRF